MQAQGYPIFRPTVGYGRNDTLFEFTPEYMLEEGLFNQVPTIRGYTRDDWGHRHLYDDGNEIVHKKGMLYLILYLIVMNFYYDNK